MNVKILLEELEKVDQNLKHSLCNRTKSFPEIKRMAACGGCNGTQMCTKAPNNF